MDQNNPKALNDKEDSLENQVLRTK